MDNKKRNGKFTSSQIYRLCGSLKNGTPTKAFYTYIDETLYEQKMGRSINVIQKTKPMKWGSLAEVVLFNLLGLNYTMKHKSTILHKNIEFYSGTPDLIVKNKKIGEIKCYYPKNFCALSLCISKKHITLFKNNFSKEYWQCVSNAILCNVDKAEIIAYMPYKSELNEILEDIENSNFLERNNLNPTDYLFLTYDDIETLPYLPDDSEMSNVNTFEFIIPKEDKEFLLNRIKEAIELLEL